MGGERSQFFKYKIWPKSCCIHVGINRTWKNKTFLWRQHNGMHSKMHRDASGESANQNSGGGLGHVQHGAALSNRWKYSTTCTRDRFSSGLDVSCSSLQEFAGQIWWDRVAQHEAPLDVMCLLFFDLWFQMLFVCQDVSVPLCDGLLLTDPDLLSHLQEGRPLVQRHF